MALLPRRVSLARQLAAFDAPRSAAAAPGPSGSREAESEFTRRLGIGLAAFCAEQGWEFPALRNDLALADKSFENFLATSGTAGRLRLSDRAYPAAPCSALPACTFRLCIPIWLGLVLAIIFFFLPYVEVKQKAEQRRKDFRHAVGAFLDLVGMNLAGGRGVPEALMAASEIGGGWSMWRIRDALANARITGQTPWQALGALGEEIRVDELRDLAAALSLVAEDGAKVRESLTARAVSLRRRELADLEGQAGERSQSMLVAQMFLVAGFLVFLVFPVVGVLLGRLIPIKEVTAVSSFEEICHEPLHHRAAGLPGRAARYAPGAFRPGPGTRRRRCVRGRTGHHHRRHSGRRGRPARGDQDLCSRTRAPRSTAEGRPISRHEPTPPPAHRVPAWARSVWAGLRRDDRGSNVVELAILAPGFSHDHHADRAVRALVQRPPGRAGLGPGRAQVAREDAATNGNWQGLAQQASSDYFDSLNTRLLGSLKADAHGNPANQVYVTVQGPLGYSVFNFFHLKWTVTETAGGPVECFRPAAGGGRCG